MMKKILSILLALTLLSAMLTGCGQSGKEGEESKDAAPSSSAVSGEAADSGKESDTKPDDETSDIYYVVSKRTREIKSPNGRKELQVYEYQWGENFVEEYWNGGLSRRIEFDGSRIVKDEHYSVDMYYEYEYDRSGNLTKQASYEADGSPFISYEYEYDSSGNLKISRQYNSRKDYQGYSEYKYDKDGNLTKEVTYNVDGVVIYYYDYEYDRGGNKTKSTTSGMTTQYELIPATQAQHKAWQQIQRYIY